MLPLPLLAVWTVVAVRGQSCEADGECGEGLEAAHSRYTAAADTNYETEEVSSSGAAVESVEIPAGAERRLARFGMSEEVSDLLPLDRRVPDTRHPGCRGRSYPAPGSLGAASVVLVFHNEALSVLLRTVTSVLGRSPPSLLAEVLLVDDYR